jgi:outer membrane protein
MKIGKWCSGLVALLVLSWGIYSPAVQAQTKIGYVSVMRVFESTNEGKSILKRLQTEHQQKQKELDVRMKAFEAKAKQFQQQSAMLKEDVRKERIQVLAKEERELQMLFMQYQGGINKKKAEALGKFEEKVLEVIRAVAKREGLTYIIRQEVLLHGPVKMDLTNQVIREYDKRYSVGKKKKGK